VTGRRRQLDDLQSEIQELFAELWQVPRYSGWRRGFRPACDVYRTDDPPTLHVVVELAGVDPASVKVAVSGQALVITGTRARPGAAGPRYLAMEIEYGPFERRFELTDDIDPSRVTASYDRGLLRLTLPLGEPSA
jgi:HSP20 family molecular chaperone IbpA